ncbi:MAG: hypothetical protein A2887_05910 [Alphaproteobacteria bacterium RIFCSPLOWO2_01_FULL_40_26]|nr:MAG: hypothetical protein A3D15_02170 [Alphaproteobacteria bacterium RIFCSPHIGHO2_02_FULL_40_34]OFW88298.1 MAG: hypothetical protein A2794_04380 [Alphaproteobacteria bacterium RIFCSPHIGHO2_01_FULL_40_8]OFW94262.1 MAG: hypothetical protein A2887_05910 [Alphaproteobacteria bacterium RIFCSPLOWO2_01_FULL_40_26]OFX09831.1 MAG: hypothetical protein A3H30_00670 [Alphaproteobacteria bacterium RIFCSPLOWO2_02_FULL_40_19]OFX11414.1 MAG: hypothetical protein A3G22_01910 [Alphaproteobacteria bacterium RI
MFKSVEENISYLLKPLFSGNKKEFIIIGNLIKNWEEIVGKKYAKFCHPEKTNFNKNEKTLTIAVHNAATGFFLKNNSEILLERIATFYGFKAISKIIIKQEPKNIETTNPLESKLDENKEKFLHEKTAAISDQNLAESLNKLGREIFK